MASSRMLALLGLLAVAGYQNRDKIGEFLGRITGQDRDPQSPPAATAAGGGGLMGILGSLFGGGSPGGGLKGGLSDLIDHFTGNGQAAAANSWVSTGANHDMDERQLETALGEDTIAELTRQTGLSRGELLTRLQSVLPNAVDRLTPEGRLPTDDEAARWARA